MGVRDVEGERGQTELVERSADLLKDGSVAARFIAAMNDSGPSQLITNANSRGLLIRKNELRLPVTVEVGGYGGTYIASPHSHYVLYARDEVDIIGMRSGITAALATLGMLDGIVRAVRLNRTVHLDNWLLSTNLHGGWNGEYLPEIRATLAHQFPDRALVMRSIDPWSCPDLMDAALKDGWHLMPARQIWVTDDLKRDWEQRNNAKNDRRALRKSGLIVEDTCAICTADANRIAEIYHSLYVGRYSAINPVFTAEYVKLAAELGLLSFRLVRNDQGTIMAAAGLRGAGNIAAVPLLGYDLSRPQSEGLYRIISYLSSEWAMQRGLRFNGSAGAAQFKQMRGARGVIEYMAVHAGHLSLARRHGIALLSKGLNAVMVQMLQKNGW